MSKSLFDDQSIEIPCPRCQRTTPKVVDWIRANDRYTCAGCNAEILRQRHIACWTTEAALSRQSLRYYSSDAPSPARRLQDPLESLNRLKAPRPNYQASAALLPLESRLVPRSRVRIASLMHASACSASQAPTATSLIGTKLTSSDVRVVSASSRPSHSN
jgi:hypothetical protein